MLLLTDFRHLLGRGIVLMRGWGTYAGSAAVAMLLALRTACRLFGGTVGSLKG